jgi:hypothetical protein
MLIISIIRTSIIMKYRKLSSKFHNLWRGIYPRCDQWRRKTGIGGLFPLSRRRDGQAFLTATP